MATPRSVEQNPPGSLRNEIERISKLRSFEKEFTKFLQDQGLTPIDQNRADGWIHFVHVYVNVVQDCPLEVLAQNANSTISKVVVQIEMANRPIGDEMLFKVQWIVHDKNGKTGEIFVLNSFSLNPQP